MPTSQISSFEDLISFVNTQLLDNNSGLIDPLDVRTSLLSLINIQSLNNEMLMANFSPEQTEIFEALITKLEQIQRESKLGIVGNATQSNAPTPYDAVTYPNGLFETYVVRTPLTMPNSWGSAVTQLELDNNFVYFDVKNGVATKVLSAKTIANPAKLPLYSVIKGANIVATTQFIDDENGNVIKRVKTGQTLLPGDNTLTSTKVEIVGGSLGSNSNNIYDGGYGFAENATEKIINSAIKNIELKGDWDKTKNYQVRYLSRNHATEKYTIVIRQVNASGGILAEAFYLGKLDPFTEAGAGKATKLVFPTDVNGRSVEATIDLNLIPTGTAYNLSGVSFNSTIKNNAIGETMAVSEIKNRLSTTNSFYDAGYGFATTANELLVNTAIKSIKLTGDWDKTKNYQIRVLTRNDVTSQYTIWIRIVSYNGGSLNDGYYKGTLATVTEAGVGKYTKVVFPTDANGRGVEAIIDYNILPTAISFASIPANTNIKNTQISTPTLAEVTIYDLFYNGKFGVTETTDVLEGLSAIKKIRLIGEGWDKSKQYVISSLSRNWSTTGYAITVRDSIGGNYGAILYTGIVATLTEAGAGKLTKVLFPTDTNNRSVEIIIDYNLLTVNKNYYFISGVAVNNNWVIRQEFIENLVIRDRLGYTEVIFPYANELFKGNVLYAKREINQAEIANIAYNKKGMLAYRIDDNTIDDVFYTILEKFGFAATHFFNLGTLPTADYQKVKELQMRGHEIADHTPNHNCNFFNIPTGYTSLFTSYIGNGIDEVVDGKAFLTRQFYNDEGVNVTNTTNPVVDMPTNKRGTLFSGTAGSNVLIGTFPQVIENSFLYVNNSVGAKIGWVKGAVGTSTTIEMSKDDGTPILLPADDSNIEIYSIAFREAVSGTQARVTLDNQSTYLLFLASQLWAKVIGLEPIKSFGQPGGIWAAINPDSATYAMRRLGMEMASLWYGVGDFYYNNDRENQRIIGVNYGSDEELYFDFRDLSYLPTAKNFIANNLVKGKSLPMLGHHAFSYASFGGANPTEKKENYRRFVYDLCKWFFDNKIKVIKEADLFQLANSNVNPAINVIPNLYADLNSQGKPDGYTLGAGASWLLTGGVADDNGRLLQRPSAGTIFTITKLGGLEKGENEFRIWVKGTAGSSVKITFTFSDASVVELSYVILATGVWEKSVQSLIVPFGSYYATIVGASIGATGVNISGMSLSK